MLRLIFLLPTLLVLTPLLVIGVGLLLVFKGDPGECGGGRELQISPALSQSYQQRYIAFNDALTSGQPASLTVTDSEATSRTRDFLQQTDAPVSDVRLCFVPGGGDISAKISTPFGPDVDVRVKGKVDLSGQHPETEIDSIQIGWLPVAVTRPFRGLVTRIIDHQTGQIELDHRLTVDIQDGQAVIAGSP